MSDPRAPSSALSRLRPRGIQLGLENLGRLLRAQGDPRTRLPAVLVAGTNGKGSTASLLAAMATAAGYRTGLFTSPHLEREAEQIRIGGEPIDAEELEQRVSAAAALGERVGVPVTAFEALTAAAFGCFADRGADLAILEAGMGGARDATNLADAAVSILTTVGLDHRAFLGETEAEIAREKAGVFRPGRPAILGWLGAEAQRAAVGAAERIGARVQLARHRIRDLEAEPHGACGQTVRLATGRRAYKLELALAGAHQAQNLALAVLAAEALCDAGWERLDRTAIRRGAAGCRCPGRLELLRAPDGRTVLLDAAHNPDGAHALERFLAQRGQPYDLLFGTLRDKDAAAMLRLLAGGARRIELTRPLSDRAWDPAALTATQLSAVELRRQPDLGRALASALESTPPHLLVVAGSLRLVGDVRARLRRLGFAPDLESGSPGVTE